MTLEESLEVTRIYSVAGILGEHAGLVTDRPFRSPHHHALLLGLSEVVRDLPRPGEVSLAHHGVLFLDELPLYRGEVLESFGCPWKPAAFESPGVLVQLRIRPDSH